MGALKDVSLRTLQEIRNVDVRAQIVVSLILL